MLVLTPLMKIQYVSHERIIANRVKQVYFKTRFSRNQTRRKLVKREVEGDKKEWDEGMKECPFPYMDRLLDVSNLDEVE